MKIKSRKAEIGSETLLMIILLVIGIFIVIMLLWNYVVKPLNNVNVNDATNAIKKDCKIGEQNCASQGTAINLGAAAAVPSARSSFL